MAENQSSKFVLQVYDGTRYRPCYIAPHATDKYYGDTKIVDTVITPSKEGVAGDTTAASTSIVPSPKAVSDAIATALKNELLPAARAKHLTTGKTIEFTTDGSFKATLENALSVDKQEVKFTGVLPLSAIPQGAQERLVICNDKNAALTQAKEGKIQQGDVVQIPEGTDDEHNVMYYMYNAYSANATFDQLFKVFTAGHATDADKLNTNAGSSIKPVYFSSGVPVACSTTVGSGTQPVYMNGGTITACTPYSNASVKYATSAGSATNDSAGQPINTTYIKGLSINGDTITYTKGSGTPGTLTITHPTDYMTSLSGMSAQNSGGLKITVTGTKKNGGSTSQSVTISAGTINDVAGSTIRNGITNSISYNNNGTLTSNVSGHSASTTIPIKVTN